MCNEEFMFEKLKNNPNSSREVKIDNDLYIYIKVHLCLLRCFLSLVG